MLMIAYVLGNVQVVFRPGWSVSCTVGYFPSEGQLGLSLGLG